MMSWFSSLLCVAYVLVVCIVVLLLFAVFAELPKRARVGYGSRNPGEGRLDTFAVFS